MAFFLSSSFAIFLTLLGALFIKSCTPLFCLQVFAPPHQPSARVSEGLSATIYSSFEGDPCVVLLDKDGSYGCRTLSKSGAVGPMELVTDLDAFVVSPAVEPSILVLPLELYSSPALLSLLEKSGKCLGVIFLQEGTIALSTTPSNQSDAYKVPQNHKASEDSSSFKWNPLGSANFYRTIPFPIWKLNKNDSMIISKLAQSNKDKSGEFPRWAAEITAYMHPAQSDNSISCLKRETCKAIGGHSTWTSLTTLSPDKKTILVISSMDGAALFQQQTPSGASDMSGLVALLATLDALAVNNSNKLDLSKWNEYQVVFAAFDAESFGYLGSKQFIREVVANNSDLKNISLDKISHIIELKQVGSREATGLFIHSHSDALSSMMKGVAGSIDVGLGDFKLNGMPPSSCLSFLSANVLAQTAVLTDHAANYSNKFFNSVFDDERNVKSSLVCSASSLLLRTLVALGQGMSPSIIDLSVNCTLVDLLVHCLARNVSCSETSALLPPFTGPAPEWPSHYPSVFMSNRFSLHQRFVHDWIFDRSAYSVGKDCTTGESTGCDEGELCVRSKCKRSLAKYLDASSENVRLVHGEIFIYYEIVNESSTEPLWTESDWTPIGLRTFQMSNPAYDFAFGAVSILVASGTIAATLILNKKSQDWFVLRS